MPRKYDDTSGPYILWTDYGCEGWQPSSFDTAEEAVREILIGGFGNPVVLTKLVNLEAKEAG